NIVKIEDFTGTTEIVLFGRNIQVYGHLCQPGSAIFVRGTYTKGRYGDEIRFRLDAILPLEDMRGQLVNGITLKMADDSLNSDAASIINGIIEHGEREEARTAKVAMGSLSFDVYSPRFNRRVRLRSARRFPLTRHSLQELDANDIEYEMNTIK
ncbi:MAG: hypothetical protein K2M12_06945, partial [Muribaculaceae bacterium]|nr:hypothetical protein [Muribaculaceae bacterium]